MHGGVVDEIVESNIDEIVKYLHSELRFNKQLLNDIKEGIHVS